MRIAVDAMGLPAFGGAKSSALGWLAALGRYDRANQYVAFVSRAEECLSCFQNIEQRVVPVQNRFAARIWAQIQLPRLLARERADVLHSMKNLSTFGAPCPVLVTVNDLSHVLLRNLPRRSGTEYQYPWIDNLYWRWIQPQLLRRAARVIAISENTKRDLLRFYRLDAGRVSVIYPSCDERFRRPCLPDQLERIRLKFSLPQSLLLYVGGLGVHKNVITLVRAFARIADQVPHGLVLVGGAHHTSSDHGVAQEIAALGLEGRVWLLGSIPAEDLPSLYHLADLFLLASLNEGFGLVLLEAMACGTPIVAARSGSVPEVLADCGLLVDNPLETQGFAQAIVSLLADPDRLLDMRAKGLQRSRDFTWQNTAERTMAAYREVVNADA